MPELSGQPLRDIDLEGFAVVIDGAPEVVRPAADASANTIFLFVLAATSKATANLSSIGAGAP